MKNGRNMGKNVENCQLMQICFHLYKRKKVRWVENAPLRQKKESFSLKAVCRVHARPKLHKQEVITCEFSLLD